MNPTPDTEVDDLDALLRDEGWRRFLAYADSQWGDAAVVGRMERAVGQELGNEVAAREATQSILAAKRHIRALLNWPSQRVAELRAKETKQAPETGRAPFSRTRIRRPKEAVL